MPRALILAFATAVIAIVPPAAMAGGASAAYYPSLGYGQTPPLAVGPPSRDWRMRGETRRHSGPHVLYGQLDSERLPDGFFADAGGVGPEVIAGGWSGGYWISVPSGSRAIASARAGASAFVGVRVHVDGHGPGHGCGCR
jgi:hypothetical protein